MLEEMFYRACKNNDVSSARRCLEEGVDVNELYDDFGLSDSWMSGLMLAARHSFVELCDLLLSHPDIDVNKERFIKSRQFSAHLIAVPVRCFSDETKQDVDIENSCFFNDQFPRKMTPNGLLSCGLVTKAMLKSQRCWFPLLALISIVKMIMG